MKPVKKLWQKLKAIAATDEPEHLRRGRLGERAAKVFLQKQGMKFLAANFRSSRGEIDLIFRAGSTAGDIFTGNGTDCLLPVSLNRAGFGPFKGAFAGLDPLRGANAFLSKDHGATWQRQGHVAFPNPDWDEHTFVERKDGSLWMLARTGKGPMQSFSTDLGKTWSTPTVPEGISQPVARLHLRRLASGRLLMVKHGETMDTNRGRKQLSAWLSDDDGKTWQGGLMLDERDGVSYPDGFQSSDGTIYISYDHNRSTDGEILMARFTEDDILAKKIIGPKSKLRMLISRPLKPKVPAPRAVAAPLSVPSSSPGAEAEDNARTWQGIPGIERAPNGRLWSIWYGGALSEGLPGNYCVVATSGDDGKK